MSSYLTERNLNNFIKSDLKFFLFYGKNEGLKNEWVRLGLNKDLSARQLIQISNAFRTANGLLDGLRVEITEATDLSSLQERFDAQLQQTTSTVCSIYNNKGKVLHVSLFCYFFI